MLAHVRDLAKYGVITDRDPYDLPPEAFSFASNVRFRNGRIESAPVFRSVKHLDTSDPRFIGANSPTSGVNNLFVGYLNGTVVKYASGAETDFSPTGYVPSDAEAVWSETHLADVYYVNREDRVPWYADSASTEFDELPVWDASWRTRLLRVCGSALVALNVTKGATNYPTMIKTSSIPLSGDTPSSWDHTDPATNATEDILAELEGPIVDACSLGSTLFIMGSNETWWMKADGSFNVFSKDRAFRNRGAISANCSVEIDGEMYVFGTDDIWKHDGVSATSICDGLTRQFIFDNLDMTKVDRCFVRFNPRLREVRFHYNSGDDYVNFRGQDGCNRCAVFNLTDKNWSFDDLPLVYAGGLGHLTSTLTYATVTSTYDTMGGSYVDLDDSSKLSMVYVGDVNDDYGLFTSLYAFDAYGKGSSSLAEVDTEATCARYLERSGLDLDELEADLRGYKTASSVYIQTRLDEDAEPLMVSLGAGDYFGDTPTYSTAQEHDAAENYKVDANVAGRFLALRITHDDYHNMSISGFDVDIIGDGDR